MCEPVRKLIRLTSLTEFTMSKSSTPSAGLQPRESGNGWKWMERNSTPNSDFRVLKAKLLFILLFIHRGGGSGERANTPAL